MLRMETSLILQSQSAVEALLVPPLCVLVKVKTLKHIGRHLLLNPGMVYFKFLPLSSWIALCSATPNAAGFFCRSAVPYPLEMSLSSVLLV